MAKKDETPVKDPAGPTPPAGPVSDTTVPNGLPSAPAAAPHPDALTVEVGDPQLLRPVELPLVVKPANGGEWLNPEQASYAKTLNAAAYSNPTLWAQVKNTEIARLIEIGTNPARFYVYTGTVQGDENLSFKNKLLE